MAPCTYNLAMSHGSQKNMTRRKNEGKGARKKFRTAITSKSKFRFIRMQQIKIFHIFVPNLEEIYLSGKNIAFLTRPI